MKTTNEIQKQLEKKSNDYLEAKAEEIVKIIKDIQEECNGRGMYYDYISNYRNGVILLDTMMRNEEDYKCLFNGVALSISYIENFKLISRRN